MEIHQINAFASKISRLIPAISLIQLHQGYQALRFILEITPAHLPNQGIHVRLQDV